MSSTYAGKFTPTLHRNHLKHWCNLTYLLQRDIKQGCPLSPLLFKLVLEGVIRHLTTFAGYKFAGGAKVCCLVYADGLCLISNTTEEM
jgi:hypothetical protein